MANWVDVIKRRRLTAVVLAAVLVAACSACNPPKPTAPVRGVVFEEGSNRPLADATVFIQWMAYGSSAGLHSRTECVGIDFARTDANGKFEVLNPKGGAGMIDVYKPGYESYRRNDQWDNWVDRRPFSEPQLLLMKPITGTVSERLEFLQQTARYKECGKPEDYIPKLVPFYRALYEEGKRLAPVTPADRQIVRGLLFRSEYFELGGNEANKRSEERRIRGEY